MDHVRRAVPLHDLFSEGAAPMIFGNDMAHFQIIIRLNFPGANHETHAP